MATTVQPTPGARYWRAPGTTTRKRPGAAYCAPTSIRPSAAPGHTATIRLGVEPRTGQNGCAGRPGILQRRCGPSEMGSPKRIQLGAPYRRGHGWALRRVQWYGWSRRRILLQRDGWLQTYGPGRCRQGYGQVTRCVRQHDRMTDTTLKCDWQMKRRRLTEMMTKDEGEG